MQKRLTTVLLADNHTMFREGLAGLLTSYGGLEVVGETTDDQEVAAEEATHFLGPRVLAIEESHWGEVVGVSPGPELLVGSEVLFE